MITAFKCTNGMHIVSRDKYIYGSGAGRWLHIFDDSNVGQFPTERLSLFDIAMEDFDQTLGRFRFARAGFGILAQHVKFNLAFHYLH
jgi:hypothetical protein